MSVPDRFLLPDAQSVADGPNPAMNRVGVKGLNSAGRLIESKARHASA